MEAVETQSEVVEKIVPTDTSASGDFGEDALSMEQELLEKIAQPEETETPVESTTEDVKVADAVPAATASEVSEGPSVEINKSLSFKAGVAPTADQISALEKEFQRAGFREADYTKKTQEVAQVRQQAEEILQAQALINQDPRNLRNYFEPKQILAAFTPQELMNYGLAAGKVPVDEWNAFLDWRKEAGYETKSPAANPHMEKFSEFEQRLSKQDQVIQQFQQEKQQREALEVQNKQKAAYDAEMNRIGDECKQALTEFKDVPEKRLLIEMAASDGTRTWKELAKSVHDEKEAERSAWINRKQETKINTPKPAKGQPVNIVHRAPKTFDEADAMVDQVYGGRPNFR